MAQLTQQGLLVKYAKPKFFKNEKGDWQAALAIEFKAEEASAQKSVVAGVDIGQVKPFSASVVDLKTQTICSSDIKARKEALRVRAKLAKTTNQLSQLYRKLAHYQVLLDKPNEIKNKNKALKKHLAYLCARDLCKKLQCLEVGCVNMEKLNWVENAGANGIFHKCS